MTQDKLGKLIGAGWTAQIYAYGENDVLKLFESSLPFDVINREIMAIRFAEKTGLPVPVIKELITYDGRHGIIMGRIKGKTMGQVMSIKCWKMNAYARVLADLQVTVNSIHASKFPPLRPHLENKIKKESSLAPNIKNSVLRVLDKLPDGEMLCHFDFHPWNILMSPKGPVIIDWTGAAKGDPMADVARTYVLCTLRLMRRSSQLRNIMYAYPGSSILRDIIYTWQRSFFRAYIQEYSHLSIVNKERFELWKIPILTARIMDEPVEKHRQFLVHLLQKGLSSI